MTEAHCIDLEQRQFPQANREIGAPRILRNALCAAQIRITELSFLLCSLAAEIHTFSYSVVERSKYVVFFLNSFVDV